MAAIKILIVDDEKDILDLLHYNLEKAGYEVIRAWDGEEAIKQAIAHQPHLILLDIMMPRMDGVTACQRIREISELDKACIVFLTARSEEYSEIAAFEAGADDYIRKPIKPRILLSRVKALLRRHAMINYEEIDTIRIHDIEIIPDEYLVRKDGTEINLPRKEFELLHYLATHPGKVFRREDLLASIWQNVHVTDRTVDVHIRKIRSKIGADVIHTIKGVGYKFTTEQN